MYCLDRKHHLRGFADRCRPGMRVVPKMGSPRFSEGRCGPWAIRNISGMAMLQKGHFEARRLIATVRPPILDESGVVEAIAHLVHEHGRGNGLKIDFQSRVDFDRLDPILENASYRIVQEALTNACKHSKSERVQVSLVQRGDWVRIGIRDSVAGFDPNLVPKAVSAWKAFDNGQGCWVASAASEVRRAKAPGSSSSCQWCRGTRRFDRPGDKAAVCITTIDSRQFACILTAYERATRDYSALPTHDP